MNINFLPYGIFFFLNFLALAWDLKGFNLLKVHANVAICVGSYYCDN